MLQKSDFGRTVAINCGYIGTNDYVIEPGDREFMINVRVKCDNDKQINELVSAAMAMQVKANLPRISAVFVQFFYSSCLTIKCLTLKMKVTEYNISNDAI